MNAARVTGQSGRSGDERSTVDRLVVSGLTEPAPAPLAGWPVVLAVSRPGISNTSVRSSARFRHWKPDPIVLGSRTAAAHPPAASPRRAWFNPAALGVLAPSAALMDRPSTGPQSSRRDGRVRRSAIGSRAVGVRRADGRHGQRSPALREAR
jgi:hypothetical protein